MDLFGHCWASGLVQRSRHQELLVALAAGSLRPEAPAVEPPNPQGLN